MTRKSKIIYVIGSVVIGIVALLIILLGLMLGGVLKTGENKLVITSLSREFVYDGTEHSDSGWQITSGTLKNGHTVSAEVTGARVEAGTSPNYISACILDASGADVTDKYNIEIVTGTITVLPRPVTVTTAGVEKTYDGEELNSDEWEITKGSLVRGHEISVEVTGSITDVGEVENSAKVVITSNGADVTENYDITYDAGTLKVNPVELHFVTPTLSKIYDGLPLFSDPDEYEWVSGTLVGGHYTSEIKVTGRITEVGSVENSVDVKVYAANGTDVSKNYLVIIDEGTLTVRGYGITISTASDEKVYDGTPLTNGEWTLNDGTPLMDGHKITQLIMPASQTSAGAVPNAISQIIIVNEKGEDVTNNYEINYSIGTLIVLPRPLTVQSGSATKDYDGKPLTCNEWEITSLYQPVSGHRAEVIITGSITDPGLTANTISQVVIFNGTTDVTNNYDITCDEGVLIVKGEAGSSGDLDTSGNLTGGSVTEDGESQSRPAIAVKTENGGRVYLRLKSFGAYDGAKWGQASSYGRTYQGYGYNYLTSFALKNAGYKESSVSISVYGSGYYLPYYMAIGDYSYTRQSDDVNYMGTSSEYSLAYYAYDFLSSPIYNALSGVEITAYNSFVRSNYTAVPQSTQSYIREIIAEQGWSSNDYAMISKVVNYVRAAAQYNLDYDRAMDNESDIVVAFLRDYKEGICQHYASAATLIFRQLGIPARYTIGYVADTLADEWTEVTTDNAHAWVEVYIDNVGWIQLEVTGGGVSSDEGFGGGSGGSGGSSGDGYGEPDGSGGENDSYMSFTVKPVTEYYKYDGKTSFTHTGELQGFSALALFGYTYEAAVGSSYKSPGKYEVSINSMTVYDADGNDVTDQFTIRFKTGILQVYQYEITVSTGSAEAVYDGTVLSCATCEITSGQLASGHYIKVLKTTASITSVGECVNSYEIIIVDANGEDVSYKYRVYSELGTLKVTAREITVCAGSAERQYNGTALTCDTYEITEGTLAEGHSETVVVSGTNASKAGSVENKIVSVTIYAQDGNDVTSNYKITTVNGLLTVYP